MLIKPNLETITGTLLASPLEFTQYFYKVRTGREFVLSRPVSRESHHVIICRYLNKVFNGEIKKLIINVPPRYGKTELLIHFVSWALANYPDSNFMYVSYSHSLAKKQTQTIRNIINLPIYRNIFNVRISDESSAKDNFETTAGGSVYAVGAGGTITGRGAGIQNCNRFGGAFLFDDIHKPDEATSDTMREGVIDWFHNTAESRANSPLTSWIYIGQRVHEHDLAAHLIEMGGWEILSLPALDVHTNALHPDMHTAQDLLKMKEQNPYVFSAQYQQDPQPAGGGIFKPEWFYLLDDEPEILASFLTVDTAETDKSYNDATVFSFWGLYKIKNSDFTTEEYALHWIDCYELRVEPKDLESEFLQFYGQCCLYKAKPKFAAIEKKSTGVTLVSVLNAMRGLQIIEIERSFNRQQQSGGKVARFLEIQPYVAKKLISLPRYGKHTHNCIEHMRKITANMSHRFDDIADTLYDAIKVSLINKMVMVYVQGANNADNIVSKIMSSQQQVSNLKERASWHTR